MKVLIISLFMTIVRPGINHLTNTVWTFQVSKTCVDTLKLRANQKVIQYDCELNYTFHGSYKTVKDTLLVTVKDDSHSEDNGKVTYYTDKYLIKNNALYFVSNRKLVNGKWKDEKAKANVNVIYHKAR
jgi:hypothetical protein